MQNRSPAQAQSDFFPLLLLTAIPFETKAVRTVGRWRQISAPYPLFAREGKPVFLLEVGLGMQLRPADLRGVIQRSAARTVVNIGLCGALDPEVAPGSFYRVNRVVMPEKPVRMVAVSSHIHSRNLPVHSLLTVSEPVLSREQREMLFRRYRCGLVDMEAYRLAEALRNEPVSLYILKLVSDRADESALQFIQNNISFLNQQFQLQIKRLLSG